MYNKKNQLTVPFSDRLKKRIGLVLNKKKLVASFLLLGLLISALISFILPQKYRAFAKIHFKYNSVNSSFLTKNSSLNNEMDIVTSNVVLNNAVQKLSNENIKVDFSEIINSLEIKKDDASSAFYITIVSNEANKTAAIANSVAQSFYEFCLLKSRKAYITTLKAMDEREKILQSDVKRRLANQQGIQLSPLSSDYAQRITQIAEFESELESLEIDNKFYMQRTKELQKKLENKFPQISSQILSFSDQSLNELKIRFERLEVKNNISKVLLKLKNFHVSYPWNETLDLKNLRSTESRFNSNLKKVVDNIAKTNRNIDAPFFNELSQKLLTNQIKVNSIDITKSVIFNIMTDLESKFNLIPFDIIDNARQARTNKFNKILSLKLKSKKVRLKNREKDFLAEIESVSSADVPKNFFSPDITLNLFLGGIFGLILGLLAAVSSKKAKLEYVRSAEDLTDYGYTIISQIPSFPSGLPLLIDSLNEAKQSKLDPTIVKSFTSMETFLKYGNLEKSLKTILVTSSRDGEGKSLVASNIAIALANNDNKVLLVDANLKKPQLNKYFKMKSTPSLAHYLFRKKELEEIIRSTHNKNLDLITCIEFPQNPSVIITSERMKNFMDTVVKKYDYVVYDSASLCSFKETTAIAKEVDEIILVVRANKTKLSEILTTESLLNENDIVKFNVVLNDVKV